MQFAGIFDLEGPEMIVLAALAIIIIGISPQGLQEMDPIGCGQFPKTV